MAEYVILVDRDDNEIGSMEKIEAHKNGGTLHRAFSVFIFNSEGKMLLQRRALSKYHFSGLWTNTCCSHPRKGETTEEAAHRRLVEECGFDTGLKEITSFIYQADSDGELSEHEFDHVFIGNYEGEIKPNPEEIAEIKWVTIDELKEDVSNNPQNYTPWFKIVLDKVIEHFQGKT
ncbi:MAG: isopentenyl-diphosphate Delta-isomerase [Candidatus Aenigmatarchaeota archaeon]